jgi:hypothetical protein
MAIKTGVIARSYEWSELPGSRDCIYLLPRYKASNVSLYTATLSILLHSQYWGVAKCWYVVLAAEEDLQNHAEEIRRRLAAIG